jgi:cytochrome d ubiquinol oxidase subunit I
VHLTSLKDLLTNDFAWWQYWHIISGAVLSGSILLASIGAYYLLLNRNLVPARLFVTVGLTAGLVFSVLQIFPTGDENARNVLRYQPVKQAAYEGLFMTQRYAPLSIIGMPAVGQRRLVDGLEIPGLLSFLAYGEVRRKVVGLNAFPQKYWPPVQVTYYAYHIMVGLGTIFLAITALGVFLLWRRRIFGTRWFLWILMLLLPFPYLANEAGWVVSEVGRQPWLVWGLLLTSKGSSPSVLAAETIFTILGFAGLYMLIGAVFILLVGLEVNRGPAGASARGSGTSQEHEVA